MWQLQGLELELRTLAAEDGTACFPGLAIAPWPWGRLQWGGW